MEKYQVCRLILNNGKTIYLLENGLRFKRDDVPKDMFLYGERDCGQLREGGVMANHIADYLSCEKIYDPEEYPWGIYVPGWGGDNRDYDGYIEYSDFGTMTIKEFSLFCKNLNN